MAFIKTRLQVKNILKHGGNLGMQNNNIMMLTLEAHNSKHSNFNNYAKDMGM